jgi:hypothetical protein
MSATKNEGDLPGVDQESMRSQAVRERSIDSTTTSSSSSSHDEAGANHEPAFADLDRFSTRQSMGPEVPMEPEDSVVEIPDEVYDRLPARRKLIIVFLLSFCSFLAPVSSTSVLAASPEVAAEFGTTGTVINLSNAMYLLFMGLSPMVWGPVSQVYGRRWVSGFSGAVPGNTMAVAFGLTPFSR